jgi:hypothetical protein
MGAYIFAAVIVLLMVVISLLANAKFKNCARLPMQWSFTGKVNWTAPRFFALSFHPLLAVFLLAVMMVISIYNDPRPGDEKIAKALPIIIAGLLLFIQVVHLALMKWTMRSTS